MKKLLAILLALAMVFALASCGSSSDEESTTETTADIFADMDDEETTEATEAEETDATDETETSETTTEVKEDASEAKSETSKTDESTKKEETTKSAGLNSTDAAEVVAYYNAAVKKNNDAGETKGHQAMALSGEITADGGIGAILKVVQPIIKSALEKNSSDTTVVPGEGKLKASDVTKAKATSKNGVTTIAISLKEQTDGASADAHDAGPVSRGITTLGSVDKALSELGATFEEGKDNVKLTYKDAYIKCTIDEKTGKITGGTWHYLVDVNISYAKINLKLNFSVNNLHGGVDYTVSI